jgi:hypothetical protein
LYDKIGFDKYWPQLATPEDVPLCATSECCLSASAELFLFTTCSSRLISCVLAQVTKSASNWMTMSLTSFQQKLLPGNQAAVAPFDFHYLNFCGGMNIKEVSCEICCLAKFKLKLGVERRVSLYVGSQLLPLFHRCSSPCNLCLLFDKGEPS